MPVKTSKCYIIEAKGIRGWGDVDMEHEKLAIFDKNRNRIGTATREEVHALGYWHETFHCWFIGREQTNDQIYLQLRSLEKKDYPNLLDITAAGHLLADETVQDGVREIQEELGIHVIFEDLVPLGILDYSVVSEKIIDNEFANVFLYRYQGSFEDFTLQSEEVAGIFKADFQEFYQLWSGDIAEMNVLGFQIDRNGSKVLVEKSVGKEAFVPHDIAFYQEVASMIQQALKKHDSSFDLLFRRK